MKEFPAKIRALPPFEGPFEAHRLEAEGCRVLFASYPAGTTIDPHHHESENVGVVTAGELILGTAEGERRYVAGDWYRLAPGERHWARFEVATSEIEFWFDVARDPSDPESRSSRGRAAGETTAVRSGDDDDLSEAGP